MKQWLYVTLIDPRANDVDQRRREFILNTLLSGLLILAVLSTALTLFNYFVTGLITHPQNVITTLVFTGIIAVLLITSRRGRPQVSALLFMGFLLLSSLLFIFSWSYRLAQAELMFALVIIIAGVLFKARLALATALFATACLAVIAGLQITGLQVPYTAWEDKPFNIADVIGYIAVFMIMGIVSWLSNRETDRSLVRARLSEAALAKERDSLEIKVAERTRQLEDLQAARLLELQPFAEFGRIGASLVHDIANPLTAASLHLEELSREEHSVLVKQVQQNLSRLEKYLAAARKQIRRESELRTFSVGAEIKQVTQLLTHRARRAEVTLSVKCQGRISIYGDAVKFDQLLANLVANAIDASEGVHDSIVTVTAEAVEGRTTIKVSDNGSGISAEQLPKLFEPFYSTKATPRGGLGLGLSLVKQYVEADFNGTVHVTSSKEHGTTFTLLLKGKRKS